MAIAKKDVFKIDNYLITVGVFFLVVGLATTFLDPRTYNDLLVEKSPGSYFFEDYNGRTREEVQQEMGSSVTVTVIEKPLIRPIIGLSGLLLLIIGIYYRKKENKIHSIWDALERTKEGKLRDLEVSLGLKRSFILDNLKHINAQLGAYYVYISAKDMIVDGRLMEEHTLSVKCAGCGHSIKKKVSLANLEKPTCDYCGAPVPVSELSKLRKGVVNQFVWDNTSKKSDFNLVVFIPLLLFFWPAAIAYIVYKKNLASKVNIEKLAAFSADLKKMNV